MKLRAQSLWLVLIATTGFFGMVAMAAFFTLLPSADQADERAMEMRLKRLESGLYKQRESLKSYINEYAPWDDTINFTRGEDPDYIDANFYSEQLAGSQIDVVAIWNIARERVVAKTLKAEENLTVDTSEEIMAIIEATPDLFQSSVGDYSEGILRTPRGLLLFCASAITNDDRSLPAQGTFLAGQWLSQSLLTTMIAGEDHQAELVLGSDGASASSGVMVTNRGQLRSGLELVSPLGESIGEIKITAPRSARLAQENALLHVFGALALGALIFVVFTWRLLERRFLRRIEALTEDVTNLEQDAGLRHHLMRAPGDDELSLLARDTGAMANRLARAKIEAESATQAKSDFLSVMSHELRTPLNGIIGYVDLLQKSRLSSEDQEHMQVIEESCETLMSVINDILDYSKLETESVVLEAIPANIENIIREVALIFEPRITKKDLQIEVQKTEGLHVDLRVDPLRVRQVITNLVSNAVKFTNSGNITLSIDPLQIGGVLAEGVVVRVSDTGIGLTGEQQGKLFKPFSQADYSTTRLHGGTGLGLAICRQLVERWGGKLTVESEYCHGSTFQFTLPAPQVAPKSEEQSSTDLEEKRQPGAAALSQPLSIILAEDNEINARILQVILDRLGHDAELVMDGQQTLEALRARKFDLVLMDIQMPGMDGLEACRQQRLREKTEDCGHVFIVAVTANALPGVREECLAAGMDDYLAKPFRSEQVSALIDRVVALRESRDS